MEEHEEKTHRTQILPDSGSGGLPPRPTAIGAADSGGDGEFHLGQTVGCVIVANLPGGYIAELASGKSFINQEGMEVFVHAVFYSSRKLRAGERTLGKIVQINGHHYSKWRQICLEDSVVGTARRPEKIVDSTLPGSGLPAFSTPPEPDASEFDFPMPELERIPEAKAKQVHQRELPAATMPELPQTAESCCFGDEKFEIGSTPELLVGLFDKQQAWTRPVKELVGLLSSQFLRQELSGIAMLTNESQTTYFVVLNAQWHILFKSSALLPEIGMHETFEEFSRFQRLGPCCISYQPMHHELIKSILALAKQSPMSKERCFDNLRSLTNYFLTVSAWNRSSNLLILQSASQALFVITTAGDFLYAWNFSQKTNSTDLLTVANFIAEYPDSKATMYDLSEVDESRSL